MASKAATIRAGRGVRVRFVHPDLKRECEIQVARGAWLGASFVGVRNAAWFVRYSRVMNQSENAMIARLVWEVERLNADGVGLDAIVPALVDLFNRP